jgi:hypothetical protein
MALAASSFQAGSHAASVTTAVVLLVEVYVGALSSSECRAPSRSRSGAVQQAAAPVVHWLRLHAAAAVRRPAHAGEAGGTKQPKAHAHTHTRTHAADMHTHHTSSVLAHMHVATSSYLPSLPSQEATAVDFYRISPTPPTCSVAASDGLTVSASRVACMRHFRTTVILADAAVRSAASDSDRSIGSSQDGRTPGRLEPATCLLCR